MHNAPSIKNYGFDEYISTYESPDPEPAITATNWIWSAKDSVKRWRRTEYFVNKSIDFVKRHKDQPFFLNRLPGYNASQFSVSLVIIYEVTTLKFECDKSLLSAAIDGVSRAITNRAAIPVLEGIYLKAEGFQLTLTGYDMEMGITTNIECNVQVPGETVLEAKLFGSMVSRMPSGTRSEEHTSELQSR